MSEEMLRIAAGIAMLTLIVAAPSAGAIPDCQSAAGDGPISACDYNGGSLHKTGVYVLGLHAAEGGSWGNESWVSVAHFGVFWYERTNDDGSTDAHVRVIPVIGLVNNPVIGDVWTDPVVVWSSHTATDGSVTCTVAGQDAPCPVGAPSNRHPTLSWGAMLP